MMMAALTIRSLTGDKCRLWMTERSRGRNLDAVGATDCLALSHIVGESKMMGETKIVGKIEIGGETTILG